MEKRVKRHVEILLDETYTEETIRSFDGMALSRRCHKWEGIWMKSTMINNQVLMVHFTPLLP